jgi:thiamine-phosphate pyrophosphorylase
MDVSEGKASLDMAEAALQGGVTLIQLRDKKTILHEVLSHGRALRELCRRYEVPFVVNDRVDVAMLLDADGVHVGQDDIPGLEARRLLGEDKIVGISAGSMEEAELAVSQGADYLGVGAVYATMTKNDAGAPIGTELISQIKVRWPALSMVGIGGIHEGNAAPVVSAGASGVAVVSCITKAESPREAAQSLLQAVNSSSKDSPAK